jgi:hypothetical protein
MPLNTLVDECTDRFFFLLIVVRNHIFTSIGVASKSYIYQFIIYIVNYPCHIFNLPCHYNFQFY